MKEISIKNISIGSFYKIYFLGLFLGFIPVMIISTVISEVGTNINLVNVNGIEGWELALFSPFYALTLSVAFTMILAPLSWLGLFMFSRFNRNISISYEE